MAADHTVGVEDGDQLEDVLPPQLARPRVVWPQDEVQETVKHKAGRGLPWVDTATHEVHLQRIIRDGDASKTDSINRGAPCHKDVGFLNLTKVNKHFKIYWVRG